MTLYKAKELLTVQVDQAGDENHHTARAILGEVQRTLEQGAVDQLIRELEPGQAFGFIEGQSFDY